MIVPDVNLLLYGHVKGFAEHPKARRWWEDLMNGSEEVGLGGPAVFGFIRLATSQRTIERAARTIAGHETDPCPLDHPIVGRLRCGEWLLFAGVHDCMHLEQLHRLAAQPAPAGDARACQPSRSPA